ncbi:hypothetical protein L6164_012901 [Bauhinia variegata]|uniref:Uncharacterized protein n=1 Tax=Bauhinia variegata TaxID=167791 RepID=A0ACB9PAH8_BAUVA|nr:hypothetical protein L6164_012901 [Bauhinia variegata]
MDLVAKRYLIHVSSHGSEALSPITNPESSIFLPHLHSSSSTSFPIIVIAVIGIIATAFLLVSYYIFVIKCCLNWHRIDLLRRFSPSFRREEPPVIYTPEFRGLDEAVIRLIPVIQYKTQEKNRDICECSVCLNEFQEDEKLRKIPNCGHFFHIDCIDVWLLNNANCPLCRTSISFTNRFQIDQILNPRPSTQDRGNPYRENLSGGNEDFVVIELGNEQNLQERAITLELPTTTRPPISPSPRKLEQKKAIKLQKVTSMGDECIDIRAKDEQFSVQPIRRSFSMDSSGDRQLYLAVQEALQQQQQQLNRQVNEMGSIEGSSGRVKRSFFSFGHGGRSRSAVSPVYLDP